MAKTNVLIRSKQKRARALYNSKQLAESESLYTQIAKTYKRDMESWQMLGTIRWQLGDLQQAETHFRCALDIDKTHHEVNFQLGSVLLAQGQREQAIEYIGHALRIKPDFFEALLTLGNALAWSGMLQAAIESYQKALRLNPNQPVLYTNLGNVYADQGLLDQAIANWRQALMLKPDMASTHSNILLCLNYRSEYDPHELYQEHLTWAHRHGKASNQHKAHANSADPERRLRIAYVTPDLREHSVAYFIEPILAHHDPDHYEVYCYSAVANPDATTIRLLPLIKHYRSTAAMTDAQLAAQIRQDGIDILVDLAGHTAGNRLTLFSHKPAPRQVSYLGYPNTTGLSAMDYRLTDAWADPPGLTEDYYTESLWRLENGFLCYAPPVDAPPVGAAPVDKTGHITFGAFNYIAKTTAEVIQTWSEILKRVPDSKLIMKNKSLTDSATRTHYLALFESNGISSERVEMIGLTPSKAEHLAVYQRVDIALDTFPYHGTTTTCDTLWMGVPVLTLAGSNHASRVGVSLLSQLDLEQFIAESPEEYINLAVSLANEPAQLSEVRGRLRERMQASSLCDALSFTRRLEQAYRDMWHHWCAGA